MDAGAYWITVALGTGLGAAGCVAARAVGGRAARRIGRCIALVLAADALTFFLGAAFEGRWSARSSLPLNLCELLLVIAAVACWFPRWQLGVELTYFWGLAGTLQAVLTPDLGAGFPHLEFFEFVVGHVGIVVAAGYLVIGLRLVPRPGSVPRIFAITVAYTAFVGVIDRFARANYMYLARVPAHASLLSVLGPWPWYIATAAAVAIVLLLILDTPFRHHAGRRLDHGPDGSRPDWPGWSWPRCGAALGVSRRSEANNRRSGGEAGDPAACRDGPPDRSMRRSTRDDIADLHRHRLAARGSHPHDHPQPSGPAQQLHPDDGR